MKKIFFTLVAMLICICGMSQTLVFHLADGTTYTAGVDAALSITPAGTDLVIVSGGQTKELPMSQITAITGTASVGGVRGDVNGDNNVDVADIATIIAIMASGGTTGGGTAPGSAVAVDMGLPSGTMWANMNVGAENPEDYGLFFAWGETTGYGTDTSDGHSFDWASYKWCAGNQFDIVKYCTTHEYGIKDDKTELELNDDAAHVNWGGDWRMPTHEEMQELIDYTDIEANTLNGVEGVKLTSKVNGNSIFLPLAGYREDGKLLYNGSKGYYWTSTLLEDSPKYAFSLLTHRSIADCYGYYRTNGQSVRPVVSKTCTTLDVLTGDATKVGGSSATLFGSIDFPTDIYNIYGTYGIIVDKDMGNMLLADAEYQGTGSQPNPGTSYSVDFRGFEPNTTYYYRAYYKFNNEDDHGDICPRYVEVDGIAYGEIKSFTTGDNLLTVDVAMCIDVTGSMKDIISTVKRNAMSFYDQFKQCCDDNGIQLAGLNAQVIAYRDKNVDTNWLQTSSTYSLPSQQTAFDSFVSGLIATGGGASAAESGLEALQEAFNKSDWGADDGYHRQVVILWSDAPYWATAPYTDVTLSDLASKWETMPSGRRLILIAPNGVRESGSGSWGDLDGWTNVMHETNTEMGFNDMDYILESIIGELTSKARAMMERPIVEQTEFRPNE